MSGKRDTVIGLGIIAIVMIAWLLVLGAFFTWLFGTAAGIGLLVLSVTICMSSNAPRYSNSSDTVMAGDPDEEF